MTYQEAEELIEESCKFGLRIKKPPFLSGGRAEFLYDYFDLKTL